MNPENLKKGSFGEVKDSVTTREFRNGFRAFLSITLRIPTPVSRTPDGIIILNDDVMARPPRLTDAMHNQVVASQARRSYRH